MASFLSLFQYRADSNPFSPFSVLATVGNVVPSLAQGRIAPGNGGHVWAVLETSRGRLHCECIQMTSCRVGDIDKLYGRGTFAARQDPLQRTNVNGLVPLNTHRYATICAVYFSGRTDIPTSGGFIASDYASYIEKRCKTYSFHREEMNDTLRAINSLRVTPAPGVINDILRLSPNAHRVVFGTTMPVLSVECGRHGFGNVHV